MRILCVVLAVAAAACAKSSPSSSSSGSGAARAPASYLTVGAYCTGFCSKLCGTCGDGDCATSCNTRCDFGRSPDQVLDGKNPKVGLALTSQNLDACVATITAESCAAIMGGQVPPACFTIRH